MKVKKTWKMTVDDFNEPKNFYNKIAEYMENIYGCDKENAL